MPVISFATSKGGAGKTTTAIALATQFANSGYKVHLLDCDPEGWASQWGKRAAQSGVLTTGLKVTKAPTSENELVDAIDEAAGASQLLILDLEGSGNASVGYAIARSHLVITPMRGSFMDGAASLKTMQLVQTQEKLLRKRIPVAAMFCCTSAAIKYKLQTTLANSLNNAQNIHLFPIEMIERQAFREMINRGCPLEALGKDVAGVDKAIRNAAELAGAVLLHLKALYPPQQRPAAETPREVGAVA